MRHTQLFSVGFIALLLSLEMHSSPALITQYSLSFLSRRSLRNLKSYSTFNMYSSSSSKSTSSKSSTKDEQSALTNQLSAELVNGQSKSSRPIRACVAIAGGGSNSASAIASTPGASSLLLESVVTYDRRSFADFVSQNVDAGDDGWLSELDSIEDTSRHSSDDGSFHFCSAQAAILLSKTALNRSLKLSPCFQDRCLNCIGVGSASSLVGLPSPNPDDNERRRKRKSKAYIACSSLADGTSVWEVELANGNNSDTQQIVMQDRRTRFEEEAVVSNLILASMLKSREISNDFTEATHQSTVAQILTRYGDSINENGFGNNNVLMAPSSSPASAAHQIISGESDVVVVLQLQDKMKALYSDEQIPFSSDILIVPGSFNPPHIGHAQLANAAVAALKRMKQSEVTEDSSNHRSKSYQSMPSSVSSSSSVLNNVWSTVQTNSYKQYEPTVLFEISVTNVDKPPIDPDEVERRLDLFPSLDKSDMPDDWGVILTNAPLFSQKAEMLDTLIKGADGARKMTFVIGMFCLLAFII